MGPGKTTYEFSVTFRLACYQQAGRVWSGGKGTENTLALAENVYVVLPTPGVDLIKLFCVNLLALLLKLYLFTTQISNGNINKMVQLKKSVSKFTPEKFYEIDPSPVILNFCKTGVFYSSNSQLSILYTDIVINHTIFTLVRLIFGSN